MIGIAAFLTARWDEADACAQAAFLGDWRFDLGTYDVEAGDIEDARDVCYVYGRDSDWDTGQGFANGRHIALNGPRYSLADIEAKRAILAEHAQVQVGDSPPLYGCAVCDAGCQCYPTVNGWGAEGCKTVRIMAAVYADHPDYKEEWRP